KATPTGSGASSRTGSRRARSRSAARAPPKRRVSSALPPDPEILVRGRGVRLADRREAVNLRPGEAVNLIVEERQDERVAGDGPLGLAIGGVAHARIGLDAAVLRQTVEVRGAQKVAESARARMRATVQECVAVGVVRRPASDVDVRLSA